MPIDAGQSLLHYRLIEQIGEGGMGVVWRALDTTLGREVAIKLLPEELAADSDRLQRFEREARVLASLNHPNIATIYNSHHTSFDLDGDGVEGLVHFLAMELVEGEDLEQRIAREQIPLDRIVEIATQIATALETAHAQGVIHRDLKPANVKLTANDDVKVLDFGLAKALSPETASGSAFGAATPTMSPTMTSATVAGMILGTAAYMSPEQARGKPVDKRTDIWAFGCVLFEMITRTRCFGGETISDTIASVLKEEPDWSLIPADTPPALRRLLRRCLAKDVRKRLADAGSARLELSETFDEGLTRADASGVGLAASGYTATADTTAARSQSVVDMPGGPGSARKRSPVLNAAKWIALGLITLTALIGIARLLEGSSGRSAARARPAELIRLSIPIPDGFTLDTDQEEILTISPDGRHVVFNLREIAGGPSSLYRRDLASDAIERIPDTVDAINPFFSPDSKWVGFFAENALKKIRVDGSAAITICGIDSSSRGATWTERDTIVLSPHFRGGLFQVRASGGELEPLTELVTNAEPRERTHRWPHAVPGTDHVLFTVATTDSPEFYDDARIDVVDLSTGARRPLFENASTAISAGDDHLVFARGGFLMAAPAELDDLTLLAEPVPVVEGVAGAPNSGAIYASISRDGRLAYVPGVIESQRRLLEWRHPDGRSEVIDGVEPGAYLHAALSPDGRRIAVSMGGDRSRDIWVLDPERGTRVRLTFEGENTRPLWTPDGRSVLFHGVRDGVGAAYRVAADGSGGEVRVAMMEAITLAPDDISPDGLTLALVVHDNGNDLFTMSLAEPDAPLVPFVSGPEQAHRSAFSPDGKWIAYSSDETGDFEVFVRPFPGPGGRWQVSNGGGIHPKWSADGTKLHYRINREWWVTDIQADANSSAFRAGAPRLVRDDMPPARLAAPPGMSVDGESMLIFVSEDGQRKTEEIRVVLGWQAELGRVVGTGD